MDKSLPGGGTLQVKYGGLAHSLGVQDFGRENIFWGFQKIDLDDS